jgi:hypothetical protein
MSDKHRIELISDEIISIVSSVTTLEATYDYPVVKLGRQLPALIILYDGFNQSKEAVNQTGTSWNYTMLLYLAAEGRNLETSWNSLVDLVPQILDEFRANPGLNDTCWGSVVTSGKPLLTEVDNTRLLVHDFNLVAQKVET